MKGSRRNRTIYTVLLLICVIGFWFFENFYTPDTYSAPKEEGEKTDIPAYFMPSSTTGDLVEHSHFKLSYSEAYEQAEWVAYILKRSHLTYDDRERPYFIEDPKLKTKSADWRNYKGSGYDRGHLCPAGDRRFSKWAYDETFYTSNISPQDKDFNAGVWQRLERQVRQWAKKHKTLFVVTAGVLERGLEGIGEEDVAVPRYFYKIVARGYKNKLHVIAFLMPSHESTRPLRQFAVSVDRIEKMTGIDFFHELPDEVEEEIEKDIDIDAWEF
ncbi:MAG: DNA/RNA non-specific endonuclease [Flavobacteriaceae bacterium]